MDWRRDWRTITIHGKTETFIISIIKESNGTFVFNLSDFKILWREKIDTEEIIRRAKSENPYMNVEGEEEAMERLIYSVGDQYRYSSQNENQLVLSVKNYISGVPFNLHWKLTKCNSDVFYEEITKKLLVTVINVREQKNELIDIVKRKDLEINQYKLEGVTLLRKHVATQPFDKQEFDRKFELINASGLFELANDNCNNIKNQCNYMNLKKDETKAIKITLNVQDGPSPVKISKSNKEQEAIRKFQTKKDTKIQYENSCELLITDDSGDDTEQIINLKCESTTVASINDQTKVAPKRKFRTKLNL